MALLEKTTLNKKINMAHDLHLPERKAFELCATASRAIWASRANPAEPALLEGLRKAHQIADTEVSLRRDEVPLEVFLADGLKRIVSSIEEASLDFPLSKSGQKAVRALRDSQKNPPGRSAAEEACKIKATFALCFSLAHDLYSEFLSPSCGFPGISLRIGIADGVNTSFPGRRVAFNASIRYQDGGVEAEKHSVVTVRVFPSVIEPGCLLALPYIVMHEIFCHWPQMLHCKGTRPNPPEIEDPFNKNAKRFRVDPFSEGWMDSIIEQVLRRSCRFAELACLEEAKTANEIHGERVQPFRTPSFPDAGSISPGHEAAELVRWLYEVDEEADPAAHDLDFLRLSCELNAADWSYYQRAEGCLLLVEACNAYHIQRASGEEPGGRHAAILEALFKFRKSGDPSSLLSALTQD
jgi:hypothetical protein